MNIEIDIFINPTLLADNSYDVVAEEVRHDFSEEVFRQNWIEAVYL